MSLRSELDEDKKQLAVLQAKIASQETALRTIQPKIDILESIEGQLAILEASVSPELAARLHPIRLSVVSELSQMLKILVP